MSAVSFVAFIMLISIFGAARADSPARDEAQKTTRITIGPTSALPSSQVSLPIYLAAASGIKVGSLRLEITFPNKLLSFVKSEKSYVLEGGGASLSAEVKEHGEDKNKSVLKLIISAQDEGQARRVIPDGPIAYITFEISKDAQPGTDIVLENKATAMTAEDMPSQIDPLISYDGKISVVQNLIISCFFYMH